MRRMKILLLILIFLFINTIPYEHSSGEYIKIIESEEIYFRDIDWKPNGDYALIAGGFNNKDGGIYKFINETVTEIYDTSYDDLEAVEWNPNGSYALFCGEYGIYKYDGIEVEILYDDYVQMHRTNYFYDISWKPNGSLAFIVGGGSVLSYNGEDIEILDRYGTQYQSVSWSPDGNTALIVGNHGTVLKYNQSGFEDLSSKIDLDIPLITVSWKPDGSYAIIAGGDGLFIKYQNNNFTKQIYNETLSFKEIAWKYDGKYSLIAAMDYGEKFVGKLFKYDGKELTDLSEKFNTVRSCCSVDWKLEENIAFIVGYHGTILRYSEKLIIDNPNDFDNDEMPNDWEDKNNLSKTDPTDANKDFDTDGLTNLEEYFNQTDPNELDTDKDGLTDGDEIKIYKTNANSKDTDGDGYSDKMEIDRRTNPLDNFEYLEEEEPKPKTDNDKHDQEIDYILLLGLSIFIIIFLEAFYLMMYVKKKKK